MKSVIAFFFQDVEEAWSQLGAGERVPLKKTAFAMTIRGITRCIFGETFQDQSLVDKVTDAYDRAMGEMEVHVHLI